MINLKITQKLKEHVSETSSRVNPKFKGTILTANNQNLTLEMYFGKKVKIYTDTESH